MNLSKKMIRVLGVVTLVVGILIVLCFWFLDRLGTFLYINFVLPLGRYYTPVNTIVYGLVLAVAIFLVSRFLSMLGVKADERLIYSALPYILIGSAGRALNDWLVPPTSSRPWYSYFLVSPPIYFVIFGYTLVCLLLSLYLHRKVRWSFYTSFFAFGLILLTYLVYLITFVAGIRNTQGILLIAEYAGVSTLIAAPLIILISRVIRFQSPALSILIIAAHLLDASATHVALSMYPYIEQHPLPTFLVHLFGTTIVLLPIKFLAILFIIIALDYFLDDEQQQFTGVLKLALLTLGLAPGMRDLLRLGMSV